MMDYPGNQWTTALSKALAALAFIVLLAGCSGKQEDNTSGASSAERDGKDPRKVLNVYNWVDFIDPSVLTEFEKTYGIHVNYDVFDSPETVYTKLLTGHSNYDVVATISSHVGNEIRSGALRKLDKGQLSNWGNISPEALQFMKQLDPTTEYGVVYDWFTTTGVAVVEDKVRARVPDAHIDSWQMVFDPAIVSKVRDCGVLFVDEPLTVLEAALIYLGKSPFSESREDLQAVEDVLMRIRPHLRNIDSSQSITSLANGDVCVVLGWSAYAQIARQRAMEAGKPLRIVYSIPREGSANGGELLVVPKDAPHPDNAHLFINFLLRPEIAARISNAIGSPTGVGASLPLVRAELRNDPTFWPPPQVRAKLVVEKARSLEFTRDMTRMWTRFKAGT